MDSHKQPALRCMFDLHFHANARLWKRVMKLNAAQFNRRRHPGDTSVHDQLTQIIALENLWINFLWHGEIELLQTPDLPTRAALHAEWTALQEEIRDYLSELTLGELMREIVVPFVGDGESMSVWDALAQWMNQSIKYRARLNARLDHMDENAPGSDYWQVPPLGTLYQRSDGRSDMYGPLILGQ